MSYLLFADDNEEMRRLLRTLLEAAGHEVTAVADGLAALEAFAVREPDLLILDVDMPRMTGLEVCRRIKSNPVTARVPVLMVTAEDRIESKIEGFAAGADDYLAKPFDARELRARVEALLRLVRRESDRNPTSGLPGGRAIEEEIARRVASGDAFAIAYLDLDNFKAFADSFGFAAADQVIRETGRALHAAVGAAGTPSDFVGHIGGDDFLVITAAADAERVAAECARRFREAIGLVLGADAIARETFSGLDREGHTRSFPIARLSAAILHVESGRSHSLTQLAERAADLKRQAKQRGAGTIVSAVV